MRQGADKTREVWWEEKCEDLKTESADQIYCVIKQDNSHNKMGEVIVKVLLRMRMEIF